MGRPTASEPFPRPRPCPFCKTETPAARDKRFVTPAYRWDCNQHGVFAFLIYVNPLS